MSKHEGVIAVLKKTYPDAKYYLNFSTPLELMVAAIMSAQVHDSIVNKTTPAVFKKYVHARDYATADVDELANDIKAVTFYRNKAKYIKEACRILVEKHNGQVPKTVEELTELQGIGRKTANAILSNAFGIVEGVTVDTHVIRVSYRLGWTKNKDPEKIEQDLIKLFPKKEWKKLPYLLKDHGRAVCRAPTPHCSKCPVNKLCPKQGVTKRL